MKKQVFLNLSNLNLIFKIITFLINLILIIIELIK